MVFWSAAEQNGGSEPTPLQSSFSSLVRSVGFETAVPVNAVHGEKPTDRKPAVDFRLLVIGHPRTSVLSFAVTLVRAEANSDKTNRGLLTPTQSQPRLGLVVKRRWRRAIETKTCYFAHRAQEASEAKRAQRTGGWLSGKWARASPAVHWRQHYRPPRTRTGARPAALGGGCQGSKNIYNN